MATVAPCRAPGRRHAPPPDKVAHARPGRPSHEPTAGQVAGRGNEDVTWVILSAPFAHRGLAFGGVVGTPPPDGTNGSHGIPVLPSSAASQISTLRSRR